VPATLEFVLEDADDSGDVAGSARLGDEPAAGLEDGGDRRERAVLVVDPVQGRFEKTASNDVSNGSRRASARTNRQFG